MFPYYRAVWAKPVNVTMSYHVPSVFLLLSFRVSSHFLPKSPSLSPMVFLDHKSLPWRSIGHANEVRGAQRRALRFPRIVAETPIWDFGAGHTGGVAKIHVF